MNYLELAKATMRFIDTRQEKGPEGIYWSLEDAAKGRDIYYDEVCMYAGASGIICFLLSLYETTKESHYLEEAKEAAKYLRYRWDNDRTLKRNFSPYAFSSGWSGVGFAVTQLYLVTGKEEYKEFVSEIVEQIKKDAKPSSDGAGYFWSTYPGIVGDSGTILFLLFAADTFKNQDFKSFATEAGKILLNKGKDMGAGKKVYQGVDPTYFGAGKDYIDPNFPMGTGGIGFTLLKLYEASGEQVFLDAVKGVPEYMDSVAVKIKRGRLLPHGIPDRTNLFYLGYCHGPAGTVRFYYQLWKMTGEQRYADAIDDLIKGLQDTGAPGVRTEGYWNTYNICCGTAGILNMYLGVWAANGSKEYFSKAQECAKVIADGALVEEAQEGTRAKWSFALDRIKPNVLTTPIGCFDGAAGIGLMLLQMYQAEQGDFHVRRFLDDPFPSIIREK